MRWTIITLASGIDFARSKWRGKRDSSFVHFPPSHHVKLEILDVFNPLELRIEELIEGEVDL